MLLTWLGVNAELRVSLLQKLEAEQRGKGKEEQYQVWEKWKRYTESQEI